MIKSNESFSVFVNVVQKQNKPKQKKLPIKNHKSKLQYMTDSTWSRFHNRNWHSRQHKYKCIFYSNPSRIMLSKVLAAPSTADRQRKQTPKPIVIKLVSFIFLALLIMINTLIIYGQPKNKSCWSFAVNNWVNYTKLESNVSRGSFEIAGKTVLQQSKN